MTNEIVEIDQRSIDDIETIKIDPVVNPIHTPINAPVTDWEFSQFDIKSIFADVKSSAKQFYANNRSILAVLGLAYAAFLGVRILFAALNAIDGIPLVSPILKLVGLVYAVNFAWNHLVKEHDRQELVETFNRTKEEIFGGQKSENS